MRYLKYNPCASISALHEHKRAYQPNLLRAILLVSIASAIAALGIRLRAHEPEISEYADAEQQADRFEFGAADQPGVDSKSTGGNADFRPPTYRNHEGFAGFTGYRVLSQATLPLVETSISAPEYFDLIPAIDFASTRIGSVDAALPMYGAGDDYGDGLPGAMTFLDMNLPSRSNDWSLPGIGSGRAFDQPPLLRLKRIKYPLKGIYVDGKVVLIVCADSTGFIRDCEVVYEEPWGCDFARALKDALYASTFSPPVIDGEKVPYRFEMTYEFCWQCPRPSEIAVVSGNLILRGPNTR